MATVINPSKLVAHAKPSLATILSVKRRKEEEIRKRMNVLVARTEAP